MTKVKRYFHYGEKKPSKFLSVKCQVCAKIKSIDEIVDVNDRSFNSLTYVCRHCAEEQFHTCHACGRYYRNRCNCGDENAFMNYDQKPTSTKVFKVGDERLFLGMEFELSSTVNRNDDINHLTDKLYGYGYCKHDGSVFNGFEFVTFPMSPEWLNANPIFLELLEKTCRSRKMEASTVLPQTNGMHIHMSKAAFRDYELYKFIEFFYECFPLVHYVSERAWTNIYRWSPLYLNKIQLAERKSNPDKHVCLNLKNPHTVEVRVFKGCYTQFKVKKNIQFCLSIKEFVNNVSAKGINEKNYLNFLYSNKEYKELKEFLDVYHHTKTY